MNLFELYEIPISFSPNQAFVKKQYFALSRKYHPDFYSDATDFDKEEILEKSSLVNKGYKIFLNQDELIKYILQISNLLVDEEKYVLPNNFLIQMMELNETLMEAKFDKNLNRVSEIINEIKNIQTQLFNPIKKVIESEIFANLNNSDLLEVKEYYFKKKYLNRILESIN